ncbi:hypothetical protein EV645_3981 [Kribbella rubisoli]|uniref:Uncharacterized protein n=1 Tax=Kribbella rubisoli TaxID=3075929 RepID=A0A4V2FY67_9ACTN|nr:hypothetical protein [Kribbella rubisoli]RZU16416.1 hypothetical protein EV645_3981 [Kribbella rubisoli]
MSTSVWSPPLSSSDWDPSSWFPSPLSSDPASPSWEDGDRTVSRLRGRCAPFCGDEGPGRDETVEDHGPACESSPDLVLRDVVTRTGTGTGTVLGSLAVPYLHGVYRSWDAATVERRGYVQIEVDAGTQDSLVQLCLTPEQARAVAAGLYGLAAKVERSGRTPGD